MSLKEHFVILELSETATWDEAQSAYRMMIQVWHPDRFQDDKLKSKAEAKTRQINAAFEALERHFKQENLSQPVVVPVNESSSVEAKQADRFWIFSAIGIVAVFAYMGIAFLASQSSTQPVTKRLEPTANSKSAGVFTVFTIPTTPQEGDPFILVVEVDPSKSIFTKTFKTIPMKLSVETSIRLEQPVVGRQAYTPLGPVEVDANGQAIYTFGTDWHVGFFKGGSITISCPELQEERKIPNFFE